MRARKKPNVMERGLVPCFSVFFRPNHESATVALLQSPFLTPIVTIEQRSVLTNFFLRTETGTQLGTETGTQLVLRAATAPWYPLTHAKSSAKSTRRAGVPCAEPIGRQEASLRQGRRLRGVPAGHHRGAPAAPDPHPVLLCLVQPLALRRLAGRRRPGDGLLLLAGTHACDALEGRAPDRRVRSSVSGTVQELPGAERRTSVDRLAVHRAECCGGRVGRAGGALALQRPVGEDAGRRCDQGHLSALASGTPRGLDRARECAAEREGIRARAGKH